MGNWEWGMGNSSLTERETAIGMGKKRRKKAKRSAWTGLLRELRDARLSNFLLLTVAGIVNAFGVTIFLFPVKLYDSGISGLSMLLDQVTPPHMTLSLFLILLNVPVFLFGLKKQGVLFTVYSVYAICVYSVMSFLIMNVLPIDVEFVSPLAGSDLLLCAIFGGVISGVGSGLTIRLGGAIDGIDVLSVTFAKRIGISLGSFVMIFNTTLYVVCGIVIQSWILPLYSIVTYYVGSKTVDFVVEGIDRTICAMIITTKTDEISSALASNFQAGGTIVNGIGGYSGESKDIVYFFVNHLQINKLKRLVHTIDAGAFIALQDVSDVIRKHDA